MTAVRSTRPTMFRCIRLATAAVIGVALLLATAAASANDGDSAPLWLTSAEVGVGPIDDALFVHLTPRLSYLRPVPLVGCDGATGCTTLLEVSLHIPLRISIDADHDGWLRRRDWREVSDFFRLIRRVEYGSPEESIHLRAGEIGPAHLGHGTLVNGYYNVVTTDHYRLGLNGHIDRPRWGAELLINDLTGPNLVGLRGRYRPPVLYEPDSDAQQFSLGASLVTDLTAPYQLETVGDSEQPVASPDFHPATETTRPTTAFGVDVRWEGLDRTDWDLTPYTDINHHIGLGSGVHTGVLWNQNFGTSLRLSSRLEYRLLTARYLPDYFDPVYEITRYRHPSMGTGGFAGPKLRAAASADEALRHGGFGQVSARIRNWITLSAAFSDGTGHTGADLRLRASFDYQDRARVGFFFYQFSSGPRDFGSTLRELTRLDGALAALEGRIDIAGPLYAQGQYARQWQLREDGRFDNIHLWNLGLGMGTQF